MKRRAILVICLLCLLVLGYLGTFEVRRKRVETLQSLISQSVKKGASSDQVVSFLDAQRFEHSKLMRPEFMRIGSHNYGNQNVVVAIKRNTWVAILQTESIQLVFVFNESDELVRFDVFPVYTGS